MSDIFQTITGGFFDSVNKDRLYSADQMNMPYKKIVSDGLFFEGGDGGNVFKVTAAGGMKVNVGPGNALIGGKWAENDDDVEIEISANTSESTRIDSVILRLDNSIETRAIGIVYRQGGTSAPALENSATVKEFRLANVSVAVNAVSVANADIVDKRGTNECPWVASIVEQSSSSIADGAVTEEKLATTLKTKMFSESTYYDDITFVKERHHHTDCYFATIPVNDSDGNIIDFYVAYDSGKNPLEHAIDDHTTLTINGSCSLDIGEPTYVNPIRIGKGVILRDYSLAGYSNPNPRYIGIKADRSHVEYLVNSSITAAQMITAGCVNVFSSYAKIVENGEEMDLSGVYWNEFTYSSDIENPLMLLGFKENNDIIAMACDGRTSLNFGLTLDEGAELMIAKGCVDAYVLDGGGSACLVDKGSRINRDIDDDGTSVRGGAYSLNVKKAFNNTSEQDSTSKVGIEKQRIIEQIVPYINLVNNVNSGCVFLLPTSNIDEFPERGLYGVYHLNCTDSNVGGVMPVSAGQGILFTLMQSANYARQTYIAATDTAAVMRRTYNASTKTWTAWEDTRIGVRIANVGTSKFQSFIIQPESSKTFTIANTTRATIVINGTNAVQQSFIILASTTSGEIVHTDVALGSAITLTAGTNQLTIANSHISQAMVDFHVTYGSVAETA